MNENTTAIITIVRHGEKDDAGLLTNDGRVQSHKKGIDLLHLKGTVTLFHSGVQRVRDTIFGIASALHLDEDKEFEEFAEAYDLQDYVSPFLHYLYDPKKKGELFSNWDSIELTDENIKQRIVNFLNQEDKSSEPEIYPSPKEMANRILKIVNGQIGFAALTEETARTNFINGTHEPVIMSFLYYILKSNNKVSNPNEFFDLIGGSVGYAEGCEIFVYQEGEKITGLKFKFRNIEKGYSLEEWMRIDFEG